MRFSKIKNVNQEYLMKECQNFPLFNIKMTLLIIENLLKNIKL